MSKRKRYLTTNEIEKLMAELDDEHYDDSDSECDIENDEEDEDEFDSSNLQSLDDTEYPIPDADDEKIVWKEPEPDVSQKAKIHKFTGRNRLIGKAAAAATEVEFFEALFPKEVLKKLTDETNNYAKKMIGRRKSDPTSTKKHYLEWSDTTEQEMMKFLSTLLLMGHIDKDNIKEYWSTDHIIETPYFRKVFSRDRFLLLLRYLHFENNDNPPDKTDPDYDRLWKVRSIFELLNKAYKDNCDPGENLAVDEVIVSFKGRVIFRQYIPKKRKRFGIKIYKLVDENGYTYNMRVYLGKDKQLKTKEKAPIHITVTNLADCVRGKGHKLFMDNFFSSPSLFLDLFQNFKINSCGTIKNNRKNYPKLVSKNTKLKKGDLVEKFGHGMTAMCWKDKREVYMLSNMHDPQKTSSTIVAGICEKPNMILCYNKNMGFVDLSDRMANSYTFGRKTLKWTKKLFFHLLDLSILNAYLLFKTKSDTKISLRSFRYTLIKSLSGLTETNVENSPTSCNPAVTVQQNHWPEQKKVQRQCVVCKSKGIRKRTSVSCKVCDVGLCINCFEEFHSK